MTVSHALHRSLEKEWIACQGHCRRIKKNVQFNAFIKYCWSSAQSSTTESCYFMVILWALDSVENSSASASSGMGHPKPCENPKMPGAEGTESRPVRVTVEWGAGKVDTA